MGKIPVTTKEKTSKSRNNQIISQYHAKVNESFDTKEVDFDEYQNASLYGTKFGDTSKWLLKEFHPFKEQDKFYSLLDVGALAHNYSIVKWIKATPIDLRPRLPGILKADFLTYKPNRQFDILCLSLVLNFVGDPLDRGRMMEKACRLTVEGGFVFIVLPKACIDRSRFVTDEYFVSLCGHLGMSLVKKHASKKLMYYLLRKTGESGPRPKEPHVQAAGFNNFKIR